MGSSEALLVAHVIGGGVALLAGPIPMLSRKGSVLHRRWGWLFTWSMGGSALAAFPLALIVHDRLLLTISLLTAFLILSGVRAAAFQRGTRPGWADWAATLCLAGFAAWLLSRSVQPLDITGLFFAAGSLALSARQIHLLRVANPQWLLAHIAGMGGAYLATMTAFLVVNLTFLPKPVTFIVPTLIGTALIVWAITRYASLSKAPITPQRPNRWHGWSRSGC